MQAGDKLEKVGQILKGEGGRESERNEVSMHLCCHPHSVAIQIKGLKWGSEIDLRVLSPLQSVWQLQKANNRYNITRIFIRASTHFCLLSYRFCIRKSYSRYTIHHSYTSDSTAHRRARSEDSLAIHIAFAVLNARECLRYVCCERLRQQIFESASMVFSSPSFLIPPNTNTNSKINSRKNEKSIG